MWCLVKTAGIDEDPEVVGAFDIKELAIGEMLKIYIKFNMYTDPQMLNEDNLHKLKRRLRDGDTNDVMLGKYKFTVTYCQVGKFQYFDANILAVYNKID